MALFRVRPLAWREINAELDYLAEEAGGATAERFLDRLLESFELLALTPGMGVCCGFRRPATRRLRRWRIDGSENWLIFYQRTKYGVEIVHVLHGARDIDRILDGKPKNGRDDAAWQAMPNWIY